MIKKIGDTINEQMDFLLKEIEAVPDTKDRATLRLNLIKMLLTAFPSGVTVVNNTEPAKNETVVLEQSNDKPEPATVSKREDFKKEEKIIEDEKDPNAWTDEKKEQFKDKLDYVETIKARLGADGDKVIDDLVKEFSSNNLSSYDEIGPLNIVAFATYLKSNVDTVEEAETEKPQDVVTPDETSEAVTTWTEETLEEFKDEIAYIQQIKDTLGDEANQLNAIVAEYSNNKITSIDDLTPVDIKGFVDYLKALSEE